MTAAVGHDVVAAALAGRRVLVVEDDALIAMMVVDALAEHGAAVVGPADNPDEALRLLAGDGDAGGVDLALLDVNLSGGRASLAVAARLRGLGVPFVFVTGYGRDGLPDGFRDAPILAKPFRDRDLLRLAAALAGR